MEFCKQSFIYLFNFCKDNIFFMLYIKKISFKNKVIVLISLMLAFSTAFSIFIYSKNKESYRLLDFSQNLGQLENYSGKLIFSLNKFDNTTHKNDFYLYKEDAYTKDFNSILDSCKQKSQNISEILKRIDYKLAQELAPLDKKLNNCEKKFNVIVEDTYLIGNINNGLFTEILFKEKNLIQKSNLFGDTKTNLSLKKITELSTQFYKNRTKFEVKEFNIEAEKLLKYLSEKKNIDNKQIIDALLEYSQSFNAMEILIKKTGYDLNSGIKLELKNEIFSVINTLNRFETQSENLTKYKFSNYSNIIILTILLAGIISSILIFIIYLSIHNIIYKLQKNSQNINNLNYDFSVIDTDKDFITINENIIKANIFLKNKNKQIINIQNEKFDKIDDNVEENDLMQKSIVSLKTKLEEAKTISIKQQEEKELNELHNKTLSIFSSLLRKNTNDISKLGINILTQLTKFTNSQIAGLYIINTTEEEKMLELVASFAYNETKIIKKQYKFGESLIGACAIEKTSLYFEDIDKDYIKITSGLGETRPTNLLITPLLLGNEIYGILEIASINTFTKADIDFIEKLCKEIASVLSLSKNNS